MAGEIIKGRSLKDILAIEKEIEKLKKEGRPKGLAVPLATFQFESKKNAVKKRK